MLKYVSFIKRLVKWGAIVVAFFLVFIGASIIVEHYIFPKLTHNPFFAKYELFQQVKENVTYVNETKEIRVTEGDDLPEVITHGQNSLVTIIPQLPENFSITYPEFEGTLTTSDGLIVTYFSEEDTAMLENEFVDFQVLHNDGSVYTAKFLAQDAFTHLAFFKIDGVDFSAITFANSDDFVAGKKIVVIKNSHLKGESVVASGIIAQDAKDFNLSFKTVASTEKLEGVFLTQIDGEEDFIGTPAISSSGEMIGINAQESINTRQVTFIIPSNVVRQTQDRLAREGALEHVVFGAYYTTNTPLVALKNNLAQNNGALISTPSGQTSLAVLSGSPAQEVGLRIGDVIFQVNDQEVNIDNPLSNILHGFKEGDEVMLKVLRGEETLNLNVTL